MKKILLLIILFFARIVLTAQNPFNTGPSFDYRGRPDTLGYNWTQWRTMHYSEIFKEPIKPAEWRVVCFFKHKPEYAAWEVEKMLRVLYLKPDFYLGYHVREKFGTAVFFTVLNKCVSRDLDELLFSNFNREYVPFLNSSDFNSMFAYLYYLRQQGTAGMARYNAISGNYNSNSLFLKRNKGREQLIFDLLNKADKIDWRTLRRQYYEELMKKFSEGKSEGAKLFDADDKLAVIEDVLKKHKVSDKNLKMFCEVFPSLDSLPDKTAVLIIKYFKLTQSDCKIAPSMLKMIGLNGSLTAALLDKSRFMKGLSAIDDPYCSAVSLFRNEASGGINVCPGFFFAYANICGDYNKAYTLFLRFLNSREGSRLPLSSSLELLCGNSNLSDENALRIMRASGVYAGYLTRRPNKKFAALLTPGNNGDLVPAQMFPFEILSPAIQKALYDNYIAQIRRDGNFSGHCRKLLKIKSPVYRRKMVRDLLPLVPSHLVRADSRYIFMRYNIVSVLQSIAPFVIPELIRLANEPDAETGVKACQLLGSLGADGKEAVPALRKLLKSNDNFTVKIAAMTALVGIGDRQSITYFEPYIGSRNKLLARAARQSIEMLIPVTKTLKYIESNK